MSCGWWPRASRAHRDAGKVQRAASPFAGRSSSYPGSAAALRSRLSPARLASGSTCRRSSARSCDHRAQTVSELPGSSPQPSTDSSKARPAHSPRFASERSRSALRISLSRNTASASATALRRERASGVGTLGAGICGSGADSRPSALAAPGQATIAQQLRLWHALLARKQPQLADTPL